MSDNESIHFSTDEAILLSPGRECFSPKHPRLRALNTIITNEGTLAEAASSGIFSVHPDDLILYYGVNGPNSKPDRIDFMSHTDGEIQRLFQACEPATFGCNQQDVFNKSYRKAGKLDRRSFASTFDPDRSGLMRSISDVLLQGHGPRTMLRTELHKLNVYDKSRSSPGLFFKAHKDTMRAENMMRSLVVMLPTQHKGGTFVLHHHGQELKFDSSEAFSQVSSTSVAFSAFYGDVEHKVEPVQSGYWVTLTYNLYMVSSKNKGAPESTPFEEALKEAFNALLNDANYLSGSGHIGFGLRHEYVVYDDPFVFQESLNAFFDLLSGALKGKDAVLAKVCRDLGLKVTLQMIYHGDWEMIVMCPWVAGSECYEDEYPLDHLHKFYYGKVISVNREWHDSENILKRDLAV
ncbi:uncharacterized protein PHACADRAFT_214300 [Phanerochaete carnosa HHB-10118-sp]|uniref:Fe2OG dioxygenase domain-containing protein n=1 Tax=Phanerochaete carnosa (strain HHB-10118-sp) TaxID=650164 RepID=K5VF50_PHACS|nr:uncharacterized protein PHACADRAFT_214300 [Phanerochaete carnosa HHB-10118-sp]EKM49778.1 hypothetical protein PHACADRAFT_214300 [Phanerochaete carnosa HHB-10118-sp]